MGDEQQFNSFLLFLFALVYCEQVPAVDSASIKLRILWLSFSRDVRLECMRFFRISVSQVMCSVFIERSNWCI